MRGFAAVFWREVAERRLLFFLGLAGFLPFFLPLALPGARLGRGDQGEAALLLAAIVGVLLALGLGASVLARDLAERRLGFYFARPLSGWAIWAGKLAAALALSVGVAALVLVPALFARRVREEIAAGAAGGLERLLLGALGIAALVLVAHAVGIMIRSRSAWVGIDLLAAGVVALLAWSAGETLNRAGMTSALSLGEPFQVLLFHALAALSPLVLLALLAASAAQVLGGRTDPRRGHRLLSLTLWGLLLAAALGLAGYASWLVAATPADLATVEIVAAAPAGSTVMVQGAAAHRDGYRPVFLLDARSGRFERLFPAPAWRQEGAVHFSADGRRAVWLEPGDLVALDLTRPGSPQLHSPRTFNAPPTLALSPDGRWLAVVERERLTVEDLGSGHLAATLPVEWTSVWNGRLQFVDGSHLRYYHVEIPRFVSWSQYQMAIAVEELDLTTGRHQEIGRTPLLEGEAEWEVSPDGSRLLVHQPGGRVQLFAAHGGTRLADLLASPFGGVFLADGRIALRSPRTGVRELTLLSPDGVPERVFAFPGVRGFHLGGEPLPGHLCLAVATGSAAPSFDRPGSWESRLLDLETGESRSLGRGLLPVGGPAAGPGSVGSRLFERDGGRLVLLDLASGRERRLAGRPR
jgi:hypothetical protein